MALIAFRERRFHTKTRRLIDVANTILEKYQEMGIRLTLRQVYYQFVAHHGLPNNIQSYKMLGKALSEGRLSGVVDWDAIEDRVRVPERAAQWPDMPSALSAVLRQFRLPRCNGQPHYVELWVEKDALASVLAPIADEYHIVLMVNRGYSSQTAMFDSALRFREGMDCATKGRGFLLYIGDHDPSGEDMVRDISDRLAMFGLDVQDSLSIEKLALTWEQIKQYKPPVNPVKSTDARTPGYVAEHGKHCWEVDALDPEVLQKVIRDRLDEIMDKDAMARMVAQEETHKAKLRAVMDGWDKPPPVPPKCPPECAKAKRKRAKKEAAKAKAKARAAAKRAARMKARKARRK